MRHALFTTLSLAAFTTPLAGCGSGDTPKKSDPPSKAEVPPSPAPEVAHTPSDDGASLELPHSGEGRPVSIELHSGSDPQTLRIDRATLTGIPMANLCFRCETPDGEPALPRTRGRMTAKDIKWVIKASGPVIRPLSQDNEFLGNLLDMPCVDPATGKLTDFGGYLRSHLTANDYFSEGVFDPRELETDPVGVMVRLLLIDKWILYEGKFFHKAGQWFSFEDIAMNRFKGEHARSALRSLKLAFQFHAEAKARKLWEPKQKTAAYKNALISGLNALLLTAEANRELMGRHPATLKAYEELRLGAIRLKVKDRFGLRQKLVLVD